MKPGFMALPVKYAPILCGICPDYHSVFLKSSILIFSVSRTFCFHRGLGRVVIQSPYPSSA